MEQVSIWNRFTKRTETRKVCTTDWEVVPHIMVLKYAAFPTWYLQIDRQIDIYCDATMLVEVKQCITHEPWQYYTE